MVGAPRGADVTEAIIEALRAVGHDGQVIFRSVLAFRDAKDAFTRTAKNSPSVELSIGSADGSPAGWVDEITALIAAGNLQ